MINFTAFTGLAGAAAATSASLLLLPGVARLKKSWLAMLLSAAFILMLVPFGGMPGAAYVRGVSGDLSITALMLVWCALSSPWCTAMDAAQRRMLLILIALAALALYPLALGAGNYDPYRLGYGNALFVTALLLMALLAWYCKFPLIALCIAFAMLAWSAGWYESDNLWDYLLDPFVSLYALLSTLILIIKKLLK